MVHPLVLVRLHHATGHFQALGAIVRLTDTRIQPCGPAVVLHIICECHRLPDFIESALGVRINVVQRPLVCSFIQHLAEHVFVSLFKLCLVLRDICGVDEYALPAEVLSADLVGGSGSETSVE